MDPSEFNCLKMKTVAALGDEDGDDDDDVCVYVCMCYIRAYI